MSLDHKTLGRHKSSLWIRMSEIIRKKKSRSPKPRGEDDHDLPKQVQRSLDSSSTDEEDYDLDFSMMGMHPRKVSGPFSDHQDRERKSSGDSVLELSLSIYPELAHAERRRKSTNLLSSMMSSSHKKTVSIFASSSGNSSSVRSQEFSLKYSMPDTSGNAYLFSEDESGGDEDEQEWVSEQDEELRQQDDWNTIFQRISSEINGFGSNTPVNDQIDTYTRLIQLSSDFLAAAEAYGRIIINEVAMSMEEKTIKPVNIGGVIGGEKFLFHQILFKFSVDEAGIFKGSGYSEAAKISGHELTGLMSIHNCNVADLHIPMAALVDYRGFRLVAMTRLPIHKGTLRVGSADGGVTVHADPKIVRKMQSISRTLNLKTHEAGVTPGETKVLHTPVDLEAHRGADGKAYLCDFSRLMPPQAPPKDDPSAYLYQLFRPEFVSQMKTPLCSDGFSRFTKGTEKDEEHRAEIVEATRVLMEETIPEFAHNLAVLFRPSQRRPPINIWSFNLTSLAHAHGINMRHLFRVYECLKEEDYDCRLLLLCEMVARVIKLDIRDKHRRMAWHLRGKAIFSQPFLRALARRLNIAFTNTLESSKYWQENVRTTMISKYRITDGKLMETDNFKVFCMGGTFHNAENASPLHLVFSRVQQMIGFVIKDSLASLLLHESIFRQFVSFGNAFSSTHLLETGVRVKHMNIISYAKGFLMLVQGSDMRAGDPVTAMTLLQSSVNHFEEALASNTQNKVVLRSCAMAIMYLSEEKSRVGHEVEADMGRALCDAYFRRSVQADPRDSVSNFFYAQFLDRDGRKEKAELYFEKSLECDPLNIECLKRYGDMCSEQGKHDPAEKLYLRAQTAAITVRKELLESGENSGGN